jgi:hypothetical protein
VTISIGFTPAVPCCTIQGITMCGEPATAGILYPTNDGNYILQPFCQSCTQALLRVYGPHSELFPPVAAQTALEDAERIAERAIRVVGRMKRFGGE